MDTWMMIDRHLLYIANFFALVAVPAIAGFIYFYASKPVYYTGDEQRKWFYPRNWKPIPGKRKWYRRGYSNIWRSTEIGRTLMYQKIAWLAFMIFAVVNLALGTYPLQNPLRVIIYGSLLILFYRVFFTLRRLQKMGTAAAGPVTPETFGEFDHEMYDGEPVDLGLTTGEVAVVVVKPAQDKPE